MSFPLFLARRLPLSTSASTPQGQSKLGHRGITVAVTGITLSVAVMIVSICVMTGFSSAIRDKIAGFEPQIAIGISPSSDGEVSTLISVTDIRPAMAVLPEDARVSMTIKQPVILKTPDNFSGAVIKGVDNSYDWSFLSENLVEGVIPDYTSSDTTLYHVVASGMLVSSLGLGLGDKVDSYFLGDDAYRTRRLKIAGIYDTHFSDYDKSFIFSSIGMLQAVAGVADSCGTVAEINSQLLTDPEDAERAAELVNAAYIERLVRGESDRHFTVLSVNRTAVTFFSWLQLLDTNVEVILVIMSVLTALTLVSSLFILILRHVATIGLLKALGASNRQIRSSFMILTCRILLRGLLLGNVLGLALVSLQARYHFLPLDPEAYYLDHVPVEISAGYLLLLNAAVIVLASVVLLLPSAIISTISPARSMRYD